MKTQEVVKMPEVRKAPGNNGAASEKNSRPVIIIVMVMLVVAGIAIYWGSTAFSAGAGSTVNVEVPLIVTKLTQPSTGQEYNVQTLFSVKLDKMARSKVSDTVLEEALTSIMQQMDIDRILGKGRVDYINTRATELLTAYLVNENVDPRVVVVDLATDDRVTLTDPEDRSSDIMEGIFPNLK